VWERLIPALLESIVGSATKNKPTIQRNVAESPAFQLN
jgi:hypothetical protein